MLLSELEIRYNLSTHSLIRENGELVATFSSGVSTQEAFNIADALQSSDFENETYELKEEIKDFKDQIENLEQEVKKLEKEVYYLEGDL